MYIVGLPQVDSYMLMRDSLLQKAATEKDLTTARKTQYKRMVNKLCKQNQP